jgi:hypothetical protein
VFDRLPHDAEVHSEVLVGKHVPHVPHFCPRHIRITRLGVVADMASRLTDDLQVVKDRVDGLAVGGELLKGQASDLGGDIGDRFENVLDSQLQIPRRHGLPPRGFCPAVDA